MSSRSALIIEDDADLGAAYAAILAGADIETGTTLVQDGRSALATLATTTPDLVLLDLHLPLVSGPEILDYIRADQRLEATKVVIVSADEQLGRVAARKADHVLLKPFSADDLIRVLESLWPGAPTSGQADG